MNRIEYSHKPNKCPVCGSKRVATILYGLPMYSEELMQKIETGKISLGGCCITEDDPKWECADCGAQVYKKQDLWNFDC